MAAAHSAAAAAPCGAVAHLRWSGEPAVGRDRQARLMHSAWRSETQSSSSLSVQTQLCRFGKLCGHQSSSALAQLARAR